jgi:hypothetical protein
MERHKEYVKKCLVCEKTFVATRKDAKFCSVTCRSRKTRGQQKDVIKLLSPRNTYFSVYKGKYLKIIAPEGCDISKELNLRLGSERLIKSIEGNKRYTIEYLPMQ